MTDLDKLKDAFKTWAIFNEPEDARGYSDEVAALFFPFVAHILNDPSQSIKHLGLINTLKFKLGMKLMSHEMVGVELESKEPVK